MTDNKPKDVGKVPPGLQKDKHKDKLEKWKERKAKLQDKIKHGKWKPKEDRRDLPEVTKPIPEPCTHNEYCVRIEKDQVYDGDTVTNLIIQNWPTAWHEANLRLARINTPELRGKNVTEEEKELGYAARDALRELICGEDKRVRVQLVGEGPYSRYIAELWVINKATGQQWENVSDWMLSNHYAVPYKG